MGSVCTTNPALPLLEDSDILQVRVVRIFNTYGPRMALDDGRVVSNFLTQALTGKPLTIYGDGQQTRSFQYISDLISGIDPWTACCCALMQGCQENAL